MLANNRIQKIDPAFGLLCPKLTALVLTNNRLGKFQDIDALASGCPHLERLSLMGNLVVNLPHYRLYTVFKLRSLKVLDFQKVSAAERTLADATFLKTENIEEVKKADLLTGETLAHQGYKGDDGSLADHVQLLPDELAKIDRKELQREIAQIDQMLEQLQQ